MKHHQATVSKHRLPPQFVAPLGRNGLAFGFCKFPRGESSVQSDEFRSRENRAKKNMARCHLRHRPRLQADLAGIAAQFSSCARTQADLWQISAGRVRGIQRNTVLWNVSSIQTLRATRAFGDCSEKPGKTRQSRRTSRWQSL